MIDLMTYKKADQYEILVVDDTLDNLRFLKLMLEKRGYFVRAASEGSLALQSVSARVPDLILLDVKMPEMDGYEVCRHLKFDDRSREVPVIFISALDGTIDKVKGFKSGGVDYITKPFEPEEVFARVETHLALRDLQKKLEDKNTELQKAMDEIKILQGIISICSYCKKIRNDDGYWEQMEQYIRDHSEAEFSHGICQECAKKLLDELSR
jgi:PleD family two-component response regulator